MTHVFLNYSAQDRALAGEVADALKNAGLLTWQDQEKLMPGVDVVSVIRDALEKAGCIVTLWTPHSVRSDWVLAEAKIGLERGTLFPVAVGIDARDIPIEFRNVQALITRGNAIDPDELNRLIKDVHSYLAHTQRPNTRQLPREIAKDNAAIVARAQQANKKAFVSYATEDEEIAVDLVTYLEGSDCPCWIGFRDVDPGEDYRASITAAIAEIKFLVLVYSAHVNTSFDVATELLLARKRNKRRLVVKIDASEPDGPVEYELATVQWLDGQKDRTKAFEKIAQRARLF
jgi:hypothetical protein